MNYILFDDASRKSLKPLTYIRPVCEIRVGILTIREKWEKYLQEKTSTMTEDYLTVKYPAELSDAMMLINGSVCPNLALVEQIKSLKTGQTLVSGDNIIAMYKTKEEFLSEEEDNSEEIKTDVDFIKITNPWDIFVMNDRALREDFALLTKGRKSAALSDTNRIVGPAEDLFIEEGAVVECSVFNTKEGPIYW